MLECQKGLLKLISSPFCREQFKNREVKSLKNIITVALSVTVMSIVYLPKFGAPPVKIGVLWGDGASQNTVCRLNSKPIKHVFELPRKISQLRTPTNLADTAHRF